MTALPFPTGARAPALASAPTRLAGATRAAFAEAVAEIGAPERDRKMRAAQLWHWVYHRGARDFGEMRNIARPVIEKLAERYTLARPEIVTEQVSADGTRKWLMRMPPAHAFDKGAEIECVYIPENDRGTLCVSSQVGCTLTCTFCHTGTHAAGAQPHERAEIVAPTPRRARPARRLPRRHAAGRTASCPRARACARSRTSSSWAWASRSTISRRARRHRRADRRRWPCRCRSAASPSRPPASCRKWRGWDEACGTMLAVSLHATNDALARQARAAEPQIPHRAN